MVIHPNTPILIGVGQIVDHWDDSDASIAPSPASLITSSAIKALADTGAVDDVAVAIDRIIIVRTMLDSVPGAPQPFGKCANPPATLAAALGLSPSQMIYSVVGGDQPQTLVNESAVAIFNGEADTILLAGAEATAAMKLALKKGITLDWSASAAGDCEDRGYGARLLSTYEIKNGLGAPTQTYPAFEHALRGRLGNSRAGHNALMAELWASFSSVAAKSPYAQFPQLRSADFLASPSSENYPVADPYLKWHVAQDAVNQGAAVILTSVRRAAELGVDPAKWIYLHGYAQAADLLPTERADLSRSLAIELTLKQALANAGKSTSEIGYFDLYSCFPCAVLLAAEAIGLDWRAVPATVTGGLPFFGGAGNNYSMHAIATMVELLRASPDQFGLVLANGGFLSKEAVGIYSARPKEVWVPQSSAAIQSAIAAQPSPTLLNESTEAIIKTYSIIAKKGAPDRGYVIGENDDGRILARVQSDELAALQTQDPLGRSVKFVLEDGINFTQLR